MTKFEVALFDMDGLLLDSERPIREAWIGVCSRSGVVLNDESYQGAIGRNATDSRAHIMSVCGADFDYDGAAAKVAIELENLYGKNGYPLKEGTIELLQWLKGHRVPCAVASSSNLGEVERRLGNAGILSYFDAIAGGNEVIRGKPFPDLYLLASSRLSIASPEHCLVFEDSEPGACAAIAAGMKVVVVPDLKTPGPNIVAESLAILPSLQVALRYCPAWFEVS